MRSVVTLIRVAACNKLAPLSKNVQKISHLRLKFIQTLKLSLIIAPRIERRINRTRPLIGAIDNGKVRLIVDDFSFKRLMAAHNKYKN